MSWKVLIDALLACWLALSALVGAVVLWQAARQWIRDRRLHREIELDLQAFAALGLISPEEASLLEELVPDQAPPVHARRRHGSSIRARRG